MGQAVGIPLQENYLRGLQKMINTESNNPGYGDNFSTVSRGRSMQTPYGKVRSQTIFSDTVVPISNHLKTIKNGIFIEIGVFGGSTLLSIYDLCKCNNIQIFGIDPFENIDIFNGQSAHSSNQEVIERWKEDSIDRKEFLYQIIEKENIDIRLIESTSQESYELFEDNTVSCLHIDGDHSYYGVKQDLNLFWPKINSGGMIINDDYSWTGCKKAIDEFVKHNISDIAKVEKKYFNKHILYKK